MTLTDFLENIVQQFNFETDVGIALIREYLGMRPYLMESIPPGQYSDSTLVLSVAQTIVQEGRISMIFYVSPAGNIGTLCSITTNSWVS